MSYYDTVLTLAERRALKKHVHDLQDEIDLVRTLVKRELETTADIETICQAAETITKLSLARKRLTTTPDDELRLAFQAALNALEEADS